MVGQTAPANHLVNALPRADRVRVLRACTQVDLKLGQILCDPGQRMRYAWFPLNGYVSLSTPAASPTQMEVDLVGNEGMLGAPLVLGVTETSKRALVLGAGRALRMSAAALNRELNRGRAFRRLLNRYLHVLMMQLAQNTKCIASHKIEQRLARLLLMSQDRASANALSITQAALAAMLGVRRVGVTEAAGALQRRELIRYSRGRLAITDRVGLERASCSCYGTDRASHQRWLG